jgi:glycerate 2-kinase
MKIQNFDALATTPLRRDALMIAEAGLEAIDTKAVVKQGVRLENDTLVISTCDVDTPHIDIACRYPLAGVKRVMAAAVGKCAFAAAEALEDVLGERLAGGVAIGVHPAGPLKKIQAFQGTHPMPSEANVAATKTLVAMLNQCEKDDFVIFVISGGGSTLLSMPEHVGFAEEAKIVHALFAAGATIEEMNVIRKHLSLARGGYLAAYAYPARSVALIFSDVIGNDIQFVASGPTVKDETTIAEAEAVMAKYDVLAGCGIERCDFIETPKNDGVFQNVANVIFVSNEMALTAMRAKADELGYSARIRDTRLSGEASKVGVRIAKETNEAYAKSALLYGGETTVTIRSPGKGGRSQELALAAVPHIEAGQLILPFASDGRDNTDVAGALCDILTKEKAEASGFSPQEYLGRNASYDFFLKVGGQVVTGDTGSNVSDLVVALKE